MNAGLILKHLRLVKGCSQLEIAKNLHISRTAYSAWENGKVDLTLSQVEKIASAYNLGPVNLVKMFFEGIDLGKSLLSNQLRQET